MTHAWDVVGIGANSVDFVHLLPGYPQPFGSFAKMKIERQEILCGGQTATAMCACARLATAARLPESSVIEKVLNRYTLTTIHWRCGRLPRRTGIH